MPRPYWSGRIQVSLVSFGVQLFTATDSKSAISFHQISRNTGERIRHQKVLESSVEKYSDGPAVPVEKDEIVKGYEYQKGQYVIIEPSELENLKVPSKHTIEVTQFVETNELLPEYIENPKPSLTPFISKIFTPNNSQSNSLTERGVHIVFVKENLTFPGEDLPMSNLLLSDMGAFARFKRELIRERQRKGILTSAGRSATAQTILNRT